MDAIDSTFVSSVGEYVNRLEHDLAKFVGAKRAVATVNGTAALQVALRLVGVQTNDEVITQPLTFIATANAIVYNGGVPVFLDVDRKTMGLSAEAVGKFLDQFAERQRGKTYNRSTGRRISAIVPVHTLGHPCQITSLLELADRWHIPVIEDAAEALGSLYKNNNKYCGTLGKIGIFSFNGNKTITSGGGGAIITNDDVLADRAKHLTTTAKVNHPWKYDHDQIGYNFRLPNLNAALACAQLDNLNDFLVDKRKLANNYKTFFSDVDWAEFICEPEKCTSNYWLNGVIFSDIEMRDSFLQKSNNAGVMTRPLWSLLSECKMFNQHQTDSLENSKWLQDRVVNLPSSVRLEER